jgi:hypothetical protein
VEKKREKRRLEGRKREKKEKKMRDEVTKKLKWEEGKENLRKKGK